MLKIIQQKSIILSSKVRLNSYKTGQIAISNKIIYCSLSKIINELFKN